MNISPIRKTGPYRIGSLHVSRDKIVEVLGFDANVTDLDDEEKVSASWGFKDRLGRESFIWCYKGSDVWSVGGNIALLKELFDNKVRVF